MCAIRSTRYAAMPLNQHPKRGHQAWNSPCEKKLSSHIVSRQIAHAQTLRSSSLQEERREDDVGSLGLWHSKRKLEVEEEEVKLRTTTNTSGKLIRAVHNNTTTPCREYKKKTRRRRWIPIIVPCLPR